MGRSADRQMARNKSRRKKKYKLSEWDLKIFSYFMMALQVAMAGFMLDGVLGDLPKGQSNAKTSRKDRLERQDHPHRIPRARERRASGPSRGEGKG
jgi:hypothetical protein